MFNQEHFGHENVRYIRYIKIGLSCLLASTLLVLFFISVVVYFWPTSIGIYSYELYPWIFVIPALFIFVYSGVGFTLLYFSGKKCPSLNNVLTERKTLLFTTSVIFVGILYTLCIFSGLVSVLYPSLLYPVSGILLVPLGFACIICSLISIGSILEMYRKMLDFEMILSNHHINIWKRIKEYGKIVLVCAILILFVIGAMKNFPYPERTEFPVYFYIMNGSNATVNVTILLGNTTITAGEISQHNFTIKEIIVARGVYNLSVIESTTNTTMFQIVNVNIDRGIWIQFNSTGAMSVEISYPAYL